MTRLAAFYKDEILPKLMDRFNYSSVMAAPKITKITLNMGLSEAVADKKVLQSAVEDMTKITGQKPVITLARKSIAGFKIRDGMPIGCKVTLRRSRMYEFLDRLVNISIPRIRDFRGLNPRSFDGRGSYSMGIREQIIFPEIDYDKIDALRGMDITITTSAKSDEEARALLELFQFPFRT
jgi:large subunit ribosomal protein L5